VSDELDRLSEAVLHEGYLLYPYRPSALKNQRHYPLGALYPESFCAQQAGDRAELQMQAVALAPGDAEIEARLRFLQHLTADASVREARVPAISMAALTRDPLALSFSFPPIDLEISVAARAVREGVFELTVRVRNRTSLAAGEPHDRQDALLFALVSPQLLLAIRGGSFASLIDPPAPVSDVVAGCRNLGVWPVLVGDRGANDRLLASSMILEDHPRIAPESPGDFFDGTEIDELLSLRILTLCDEEKREMAQAGSRARALLDRTEALGCERLPTLHGTVRKDVAALGPGARVRLRPTRRADILDLVLAGKQATVESVQQDLEGRTYVAVTIDDDPGRDLGAYGHRFFFGPEEVEPL
jgi:hypothetical protein